MFEGILLVRSSKDGSVLEGAVEFEVLAVLSLDHPTSLIIVLIL